MTETLFRERGFGAVSIADIASALGMSPANVFKHFQSKTVLVNAIFVKQIHILEQKIHIPDDRHPPRTRMLDFVRTLLENHRRDLNDNPYIFDMILQTARQDFDCGRYYNEILANHLATIIRDGVRQQHYHTEDPLQAARVALQALTCVLHPVLIAQEELGILATRCEEVVTMIDLSLRHTLEK